MQFVSGMRTPVAGPYLLNVERIFLYDNWLTMHIQKLKQEQFDGANALATPSDCKLLRAVRAAVVGTYLLKVGIIFR